MMISTQYAYTRKNGKFSEEKCLKMLRYSFEYAGYDRRFVTKFLLPDTQFLLLAYLTRYIIKRQ